MIIDEVGIQVLEGYSTTDNCYGVVPTPNFSCRSAQVNVLEFWHQRFGHANFKQVAKVSKLEAVVGLPKLERWRRLFVALVKWENKQRRIIKR